MAYKKTNQLKRVLQGGKLLMVAAKPKTGHGVGNCTPVKLLSKCGHKLNQRGFLLKRIDGRILQNRRNRLFMLENEISILEAIAAAN
jgi:hypothetical protein